MRRCEGMAGCREQGWGRDPQCTGPAMPSHSRQPKHICASTLVNEGGDDSEHVILLLLAHRRLPMVDIVEIALDTISDFSDFEKLACEVLRHQGCIGIQRLGGFADSGQDAVEECFYYRSRKRTRKVFQITTQKTIETKLKDTIKRLEETETEFTHFCLVTSRDLTTARIQTLTQIADELDAPLTVFDRKTFVQVLSEFSNGIFNRHFPDIDKQLRIARQADNQETIDHEQPLRLAMVFTGITEADRARQSVIRELALALLVSIGSTPVTSEELVAKHHELLPSADSLQIAQVKKALDYWIPHGMIKRKNGAFEPTEAAFKRARVAEMHWDRHRVVLASDVADAMENITDGELGSTVRNIVERNVADAISELFRVSGLEVSFQLLGNRNRRNANVQGHETFNSKIRKDLSKPIGELATACLGDILSTPNDEQAQALSTIAYGYMGASLVQVDPAVREFQETRIRKKVFVIDTDFLLDCIVKPQPRQKASFALVRSLTAMGAKVVVPSVCITEAADHASIAQKTVNFFGDSIFGLSEHHAIVRINNKFAQGWYFRCSQSGKIPFSEYLQNYYEIDAPDLFMEDVVRSELPDGVEIGNIEDLLEVEINQKVVEKLANVLSSSLAQSTKSQYRTSEEVYNLSLTDSCLYVATALASQAASSSGNHALRRNCYLITSSTRFISAVRKAFHRKDDVSVRPETLIGLLALVGRSDTTPRDFVSLFDNPFLQISVANAWPDLKDLLKVGISLKNHNQARLTWDLENGLHQRIAVFRDVEESAVQLETEEAQHAVDKSVVELLELSRNRGYKPMDHTDALLRSIEPIQAENTRLSEELNALSERYVTLESEINHFGKRRQRYLRSIGKGEQKPKAR